MSDITQEVSALDSHILHQSGVSSLTNKAIGTTLVTGGSLLGVMGGVQAAGFSAYIMAAQASAIIPLVGGKTLVSLLAVVANPLFVIPAIGATGVISHNSLQKSIKRSFGIIISTLLLMRGSIYSPRLCESEKFLHTYGEQIAVIIDSNELGIKLDLPPQASLALFSEIDEPHISQADQTLLLSMVEIAEQEDGQIVRIVPSSAQTVDNYAIAGLTCGDFLYDIAAIDPHVIAATDFARKDDISDVFEFAYFAESLRGISDASLRGHQANLMGYTAERLVASQLVKDGHVIEIPESATQAGYDLLVDGNEFQVKCIKPENFSILEKHFETYPDTPVFVNAEIAKTIADKAPEWERLVYYVGGYTHEQANGLLAQAVEAGQGLNDYGILSSVALVSTIRNANEWRKGTQSLPSATFNIALDSASKGTMAVAGGIAGTGVGMLLFGPAGAYILGGVSTVFGATQGNVATNTINALLALEREEALKTLADDLLDHCNAQLAIKIALLDQKISQLSDDGIASYVRYRFTWEKLHCMVAIKRHDEAMQNQSINGKKKAFRALKLASESTVHPYCLQKHYNAIAEALNQKNALVGKVGSWVEKSASFAKRKRN